MSGLKLQDYAHLKQCKTQFSSSFMERIKHVSVLFVWIYFVLVRIQKENCHALWIGQSIQLQIIWKWNREGIWTMPGRIQALFSWRRPTLWRLILTWLKGCCRGLQQQAFISLQFWSLEVSIKVPGESLGKASLLGPQTATISLCAHVAFTMCTHREGARSVSLPFLIRTPNVLD